MARTTKTKPARSPATPEPGAPSPKALQLVVGLGNPGPRYAKTRHNAGFLVVDALAARQGLSFRKVNKAEEARAAALGITLLKPQTFMNLSGAAVQAAVAAKGLRPSEMLVIHDDLDLPLGRLRFRSGGSAGGQGGIKDIIARLGPDFHRLKIGIGRPPPAWTVEGWVLSRFKEDEAALLEAVVSAAADAVELALHEGLAAAMNRFNGLDLRAPVTLPDAEPTG